MAEPGPRARYSVQRSGRTYIPEVRPGNEYYARHPGDNVHRSNWDHERNQQLFILIPNAQVYDRQVLLDAVNSELNRVTYFGFKTDPRTNLQYDMVANPPGREFLRRIDEVYRKMKKLYDDMHTLTQRNAAGVMFDRLVQSVYPQTQPLPDSLANNDLGEEFLVYVTSWFSTRFRFLWRRLRKSASDQDQYISNDEDGTIKTLYFEINAQVHGASLKADFRAIEWFEIWSQDFFQPPSAATPPENERSQTTGPLQPDRLKAMLTRAFLETYSLTHRQASTLLSMSEALAEDITVINDWVSYKERYEDFNYDTLQAMLSMFFEGRNGFSCFIDALVEFLEQYETTGRWDQDKYLAVVTPRREAFVQNMDENCKRLFFGTGRWCTAINPRRVEQHNEQRNPELWYCNEHRPGIRCATCGKPSFSEEDQAQYKYELYRGPMKEQQHQDGHLLTPQRVYYAPLNQTAEGGPPAGGLGPDRDDEPLTPTEPLISPQATQVSHASQNVGGLRLHSPESGRGRLARRGSRNTPQPLNIRHSIVNLGSGVSVMPRQPDPVAQDRSRQAPSLDLENFPPLGG